MTETDVYTLIIGMALVTYIPRALPAGFIHAIHLGKRLQKFLTLLPYTAMAVLIVPGVFSVDEANPWFGIVSAVIAAVLAFKQCSFIICVLTAIAVHCVLYIMY